VTGAELDRLQEAVPAAWEHEPGTVDRMVGLGALGKMAPANRGLSLSVSWARSRPVPEGGARQVAVPVQFVPVFQEAARVLLDLAARPNYVLLGAVVRLDRGPTDEEGAATVVGLVDDRPRSVRVRLGGDDYRLAVRAHDERRPFSCTGELSKEGRSLRLDNARETVLVHEDS